MTGEGSGMKCSHWLTAILMAVSAGEAVAAKADAKDADAEAQVRIDKRFQ